jgi:DNA-binding transcriptional LysR family regulator
MPDLRQLRTFVAVAEQLSFTRAAEALHLKQQSVSKAVRELERELGVELLERTTREVRTTPAGDALLASGREVLRFADAAFAEAREVGAGGSGTVRVGVTPAIGPTDHAAVVGALRAGPASGVSVALTELRPGDLRRSLQSGDVDLVLTRVSGVHDPALDRAELRPTPMMVCVPEGHALASAGTVRLSQLDGDRLVVASPPGTPYTDMLLARFTAAGARVVPVEARVTGGAGLLLQAVEEDAIALVPAGAQTPSGLVALDADGVTVPLRMVWAAGLLSPAVRRVRAALGVD